MSNHTPGPWRYEPSAAGTWVIYTDGLPGESGADETLIAYAFASKPTPLSLPPHRR